MFMSTATNTHFQLRRRALPSIAAFTLVEVALAIGVVSFCLITLFSLLAVGLAGNRNANEQTGATQLLSAVVADLYATPATTPYRGLKASSLQFGIPIPAAENVVSNTFYFASDFQTNSTPSGCLYRLTITTASPTAGSGKIATLMDLKVTWPAAASLTTAAGKVETFVGLNRN
jgi:hypothetical protein